MIKSLSVDYTLQHSEIIKEGSENKENGSCISMIHQFPFGLQKVYPGFNKYTVQLIPFLSIIVIYLSDYQIWFRMKRSRYYFN